MAIDEITGDVFQEFWGASMEDLGDQESQRTKPHNLVIPETPQDREALLGKLKSLFGRGLAIIRTGGAPLDE